MLCVFGLYGFAVQTLPAIDRLTLDACGTLPAGYLRHQGGDSSFLKDGFFQILHLTAMGKREYEGIHKSSFSFFLAV